MKKKINDLIKKYKNINEKKVPKIFNKFYKIFIVFCLVLALIFGFRFIPNKKLIKLYGEGIYKKIYAKLHYVFNFSETYIAYYNDGVILYKNGEYLEAKEKFLETLDHNPPKTKVCTISVNLALSSFKAINATTSSEIAQALKESNEYLYKYGCLNEDGTSDPGHTEEGEEEGEGEDGQGEDGQGQEGEGQEGEGQEGEGQEGQGTKPGEGQGSGEAAEDLSQQLQSLEQQAQEGKIGQSQGEGEGQGQGQEGEGQGQGQPGQEEGEGQGGEDDEPKTSEQQQIEDKMKDMHDLQQGPGPGGGGSQYKENDDTKNW